MTEYGILLFSYRPISLLTFIQLILTASFAAEIGWSAGIVRVGMHRSLIVFNVFIHRDQSLFCSLGVGERRSVLKKRNKPSVKWGGQAVASDYVVWA